MSEPSLETIRQERQSVSERAAGIGPASHTCRAACASRRRYFDLAASVETWRTMTNPKENRVSLVLGGQESRSVELARRPGDLNSSWRRRTIVDSQRSDGRCVGDSLFTRWQLRG